MDREQLHNAVLQRGITVKALDQVTAKVQARFGEATPTPADLAAFLTGLPVWDKIGMGKAEFLAMPPDWRMTQARAFEPPVVHRRPVSRPLTAAELVQLQEEGLTGAAYVEKARVMQQTPFPLPQQP